MARRLTGRSATSKAGSSKTHVFGGGGSPTTELSKSFGLRKYAEKQRMIQNVYRAYQAQQTKKKALKNKSEYTAFLKKEYKEYEVKLEDLQPSQQIDQLASGEYIKKPYDQSVLIAMTELSQKLKSCGEVIASNSVRLGLAPHPYGYPVTKMSSLSEADTKSLQEQAINLYLWLDRIVHDDDQSILDLCYQVALSVEFIGEAFIEVMEDAQGRVQQIKFASPEFIWVGTQKDRYIQMSRGGKVYFKKFSDIEIRSAKTFAVASPGKPIPPAEQATKLLHIKKPNMLSQTYGVPGWTPAVEGILGNRAADERDKVFFDNDAVPRLAVVVSGGVLTEDTLNRLEGYFQSTQGVSNTGRVLILEVSSANSNSPNWKPPKVEFKPLTVGKSEDAGFLKYRQYNNEVIRESFRIADIFLGTAGDVNRAAAFTMREMSVNLVFRVAGDAVARLLNRTLLKSFMLEYKLNPDTIKVQIGFEVPDTMSQKDHAEIMKMLSSAGAYSPNDIRSEIGLDKWTTGWSEIPTALAIVFAQMGLIQTPSSEELTEGMDLGADATNNGGSDTDKARQALMLVRKFLEVAAGKNAHAGSEILQGYIGDMHSVSVDNES